jgi:hypothetical protein
MKGFALLFVLSSFVGTARADSCHYTDAQGETVKLEILSLDEHILRVRYRGGEPDRFYAVTKLEEFTRIFTEFARKKDQKSPLVLKLESASEIHIEHRTGGNLFTLNANGKETPLKCERSSPK